jgi:RHS repeat-associated protein
MKTATLTINGSLSALSGAYNINVARDALGRVTEKNEGIDGVFVKQTYGYDVAGRLVNVKTDEVTETWGYDHNGNRTHRNGSLIATFDAQDRILTQGSTAYTHNALGQRTEKSHLGQITRYDYDVFGGLKGVTLPNGTAISYAQDPLGRRIGRKVNGTWTNKWLYKDALNPIAELDASDRLKKLFVYADKGHVPAYMITYNADGTEDKQYRIVSDLLGSVRVVYDLETGDEVQRMDYDVWGNVVNDTNPGFQPFAFAGGLYDSLTGLVRFGARDLDPETGRWTAKDPSGFNGGLNLYGYVFNDPINLIDIDGLAPGDAFSSMDAAAIDAGNYARTFPQQRIEYGGWIYEKGCGYTYNFTKGNPYNVPRESLNAIKPSSPAASWHTHNIMGNEKTDDFSPGDVKWAEETNIPVYLRDVFERTWEYDPSSERTRRVK